MSVGISGAACESDNAGVIAATVVAVALLVCLVVGIAIWCFYRSVPRVVEDDFCRTKYPVHILLIA